jgi:hypothetical protein
MSFAWRVLLHIKVLYATDSFYEAAKTVPAFLHQN